MQPQAQIIWSGVKTDSFSEANGTKIKAKGRNNITTRIGARAIINIERQAYDHVSKAQLFVEGNWIHNTKNYGIEMNGVTLNQKGSRNLGEFKAGFDHRVNSQLRLWANAGVRAGTKHYRDLTFMTGAKYSF